MKWRLALLAAVVGSLAALPARAHLVTTGLGPVYDGITHLVVSPSDLLIVTGLALLAGLGGPVCGRRVLAALPAAWLVGGLVGLQGSTELAPAAAMAAALVVVGALVALDTDLPDRVVALFAGLLGAFWGVLNGTALAEAGAGALGLVGIVITVTVVATLVAGLVAGSRAPWARIVYRIAGSWLAAVGILMLGWAIRAAVV